MRGTRFLSVLLLVGLAGGISGQAALAQTNAATFTLWPGGTATVTFEAYCTGFGKKFPTAIQPPNAVAEDKVRAALAYIQSNNLSSDPAKALDAQYAIWQVRGATNSPAGGAVAKAVVAAASTAAATPQGTSVVDASKAGQVRVTVSSWQPIGNKVPLGTASDNFYGRGQLTIANTSQQVLALYVPVGALFPPTTAGDQTMAGYTTNVSVTNPQASQQLPDTSGGGVSALLPFVALLMLAASGALRLRRRMAR